MSPGSALRVRPAVGADIPGLPDIERSADLRFRETPDLAWIAGDAVDPADLHAARARAGTVWVAVDLADRAYGFLSAEVLGSDLHVWTLSVRLERQGRGAGRRLLAAALDGARARGLAAVTLTTFRQVAWNEGFYRRQGFETLGGGDLGKRLERALAEEAARGLPAERRCAMRLRLD